MKKIFFSTEELDARASAKFGLGEQILMENAACKIEGEIRKRLKKGSRILALCGGGNNGADAMAALRKLSGDFSCTALCVLENRSAAGKFQADAARAAGVKLIDISSVKDACEHVEEASSKDACAHESVDGSSLKGTGASEPRGELESLSGADISCDSDKLSAKFTSAKFEIAGRSGEHGNLGNEYGEPSILHDEIINADCIIDGIFGSGLNKALSSEICEILSLANSSKSLKIAVDIPSGIDKFGRILGGAFCADLTIAMGALKLALFSDGAKDQVGRIKVANLGISRSNFEGRSEYFLLQKSDLKLPLRRKQNTNKGDFGHTYVVSGQMSGAAQMAALAAHAIGSGLVSVVSKEPLNLSPILMQKSSFDAARVVVCGCGLGERKIDLAALRDKSCVIDADLCYEREILSLLSDNSNLVITPHPKEFCSLLKITGIADLSVSELQERRFELAQAWSEKFSGVLVLKGANTLIAQAGVIYVCDKGSAALAKGGSGDVLAGLIGGLLAQGYSPLQASICGVLAHALAARAFAKNSYALNPLDLIEEVKWL
ncbi:MAG: NAD(P)H-hydrate dehydratase [Campylobacter gracilis]|uniref:NAD(P)H-hydrate dehydratase n=1 Tax=Campylobacter gracilis TaxID=824 RepID=UPI0026EC92D7|nr:NAD(P)H-hydrate dehydratase [Campylobacter gracilis]MBS6152930.1 NAD(P)H-hydrate dehydratase [Campylobacter gracilis]